MRRHGIEEAGGEAPEPAIAEARIGLLIQEAQPVETVFPDGFGDHRVEQEVGDVVGQRPADQEFHRQVIDPLRIFPLIGLLGMQPAMRQEIPDGAREGLEALAQAHGRQADDIVENEVTLIERIMASREPGRTELIFHEKLQHRLVFRRPDRRGACRQALLAHDGLRPLPA